jgi:hypothetical protein
MESFAQMLQQTALARWISESGALYGYPLLLFLHTMGLATIAGLNAGITMRILGVAPGLTLAPMVRFYPLMWIAFALTVVSGIGLLLQDAVTRLGQTVFYVKLLFVALGVVTLQIMKTRVFGDPELDRRPFTSTARMLAVTSLALWMGAIIAGRLIAYL